MTNKPLTAVQAAWLSGLCFGIVLGMFVRPLLEALGVWGS